MTKLEFVKKLYNGKNCYSDHMDNEELQLLHIESKAEGIIRELLEKNKIVFLTGNPGDGKTFIIRSMLDYLTDHDVYTQTDLNNVRDYQGIADDIITLYKNGQGAVIAVNEYPFIQLCKVIRDRSRELFEEIQAVKKETIAYGTSSPLTGRIAIVDLNERNLMGSDYDLLEVLLDRLLELLMEDAEHNEALSKNIIALSDEYIRTQLLTVFRLAAAECEHFAVRDILGACSYIFTACTLEDSAGMPYYSAVFNGSNSLLQKVQQFDPIFLSVPSLDEELWNGEVINGWLLGIPDKWPIDFEDVDEAIECFKDVKRRYYFENEEGGILANLQPEEIAKCTEIFTTFEAQKKRIKETLIRSINKLFLPSSEDKKQLHIWTTHRFDISQDAAAAVSSKSVDASDLEILMPRPADWLKGLEYVPNHIIMKHKASDTPTLVLDIDFLRTLTAVDNGYPVSLLAPQYEQAAAMFIQKLDDNGFSEPNDDDEIIIASRKNSFKQVIRIQDGKYDFEEE